MPASWPGAIGPAGTGEGHGPVPAGPMFNVVE